MFINIKSKGRKCKNGNQLSQQEDEKRPAPTMIGLHNKVLMFTAGLHIFSDSV
jgi:hypothetical protein